MFERILPDSNQPWDSGRQRMDEAWMATIQKALSQRWPKSRRGGRPGTPVGVGCAGWG